MLHQRVAFMKLALVSVLAVTASLAVSHVSLAQDANVRVGTLTCEGQGGIGLIIGSKENLVCTYTPANGSPGRKYLGTITRLGLDLGIKGKSVIIWGVLAASDELPSDALVGEFVGAAADASLGLGAGAQILVGGTAKSLVLQPLSVKGEVGINIAVGVAGLRLVPQ
jgi:Protein of unknown function (DUF992)